MLSREENFVVNPGFLRFIVEWDVCSPHPGTFSQKHVLVQQCHLVGLFYPVQRFAKSWHLRCDKLVIWKVTSHKVHFFLAQRLRNESLPQTFWSECFHTTEETRTLSLCALLWSLFRTRWVNDSTRLIYWRSRVSSWSNRPTAESSQGCKFISPPEHVLSAQCLPYQ